MKTFIAFAFVMLLAFVAGCAPADEQTVEAVIDTFEECIAQGNPIMESYPRQCIANGQTFVETVPPIALEEAMAIAQGSDCTADGGKLLEETAMHNDYTHTWWIDLDLEKEGCSPACVVDDVTKMAEINWRCTGLLPTTE